MTTVPPTVLILDDTPGDRALIKACLRDDGYRFLEADTGQQARAFVETQQVDAIVLELVSHEPDGFGMLRWLQADPRRATIPVIVHSVRNDMASIQAALALGSYDYFPKSLMSNCAPVLLPLKVRNALRSKRRLDTVCQQNAMWEREIQAAARYQRLLLPSHGAVTALEVAPFFLPCHGLGGDFFDIIPLNSSTTAVLIADVSGHGVLSAMVTAVLKPLFDHAIRDTASPLQALRRLNRDLLRLTPEPDYVTAFAAIYDATQRTLCYANAGHPPPLFLHRPAGTIEELQATGMFLGLFDESEWFLHETQLTVAPRDRLLLVTDGVIGAMSEATGHHFGLERLQRVLRDTCEADVQGTTQQVWQCLRDFTGNHFTDDVTVLAIDLSPGQPSKTLSPATPCQKETVSHCSTTAALLPAVA